MRAQSTRWCPHLDRNRLSRPARKRLNLTIRGGCVANRVMTEDGRAVGVEVQVEGNTNRVEGRRVTLCAGAFASPAILMRSGVGPSAELKRHGIRTLVDAPGVGGNLIDHPLMVMLAPLSLLRRSFRLRAFAARARTRFGNPSCRQNAARDVTRQAVSARRTRGPERRANKDPIAGLTPKCTRLRQ
jgi:choline dehydrogenase-like flavoprotein